MQSSIYTDGEYVRANPSWHVQDSAWKAGHILAMLDRHGLSPATVCEVGCGAGEIALRLRDALPHADLVGYDISPDAISLASQRSVERLSFRLGDLFATEAHFDLIVAADVFEHVDDYLGFLRGLRGKAGWVIFHIPLDLSALNLVRRSYITRVREQLGHLHHFNADTALASLRVAGYAIADARYTSGAIDLSRDRGLHSIVNMGRRLGRRVAPDLTARVLGGFSLLVLAGDRPLASGQASSPARPDQARPHPGGAR